MTGSVNKWPHTPDPKLPDTKKWSNCTYLTQQLLESSGTSLPCVSSGNPKLVKTVTGENCSAYCRIMLEENPTCLSQHRECAYLWEDSSHPGSRTSPLVAVSRSLPFSQCLRSQPTAIQRKKALTLSRVNCWLVQNMHKKSSLSLLLVSWVSQRD